MTSNSEKLVETLSKIAPTYFEQFLDDNVKLPCISYFLQGDYQDKTGDNLGYSYVSYIVKVWTQTVKENLEMALKVDEALRAIGYRRISTAQMTESNLICGVLSYKGLARERFDKE